MSMAELQVGVEDLSTPSSVGFGIAVIGITTDVALLDAMYNF